MRLSAAERDLTKLTFVSKGLCVRVCLFPLDVLSLRLYVAARERERERERERAREKMDLMDMD